jgi:hypothetical protein
MSPHRTGPPVPAVQRMVVGRVRLLGRIARDSALAAAGFWLYQMGTPDLGTASAGRAALAKDAATMFGNPAGMTSWTARNCWSARSWFTATSTSIAAQTPRLPGATAATPPGRSRPAACSMRRT